MSGLIALIVICCWSAAAILVARAIGRSTATARAGLATGGIALALTVLPVADELVGMVQFRSLCSSAVATIHVPGNGAAVAFVPMPDVQLDGFAIRVLARPAQFAPTVAGPVVASYTSHQAYGGVLARLATEGGAPLLFSGACSPTELAGGARAWLRRSGYVLVNVY